MDHMGQEGNSPLNFQHLVVKLLVSMDAQDGILMHLEFTSRCVIKLLLLIINISILSVLKAISNQVTSNFIKMFYIIKMLNKIHLQICKQNIILGPKYRSYHAPTHIPLVYLHLVLSNRKCIFKYI